MEATTNGTDSSQNNSISPDFLFFYPGQSKDLVEPTFTDVLTNSDSRWVDLCMRTAAEVVNLDQGEVINLFNNPAMNTRHPLYQFLRAGLVYPVLTGLYLEQNPDLLRESTVAVTGHSLGIYGSLIFGAAAEAALNGLDHPSRIEDSIHATQEILLTRGRMSSEAEGAMILVRGITSIDQLNSFCEIVRTNGGYAQVVLNNTPGTAGISLDRLGMSLILPDDGNEPKVTVPDGVRITDKGSFPPNHSALLNNAEEVIGEMLLHSRGRFLDVPACVQAVYYLGNGQKVSTVGDVIDYLVNERHLSSPFWLQRVFEQMPGKMSSEHIHEIVPAKQMLPAVYRAWRSTSIRPKLITPNRFVPQPA